MDDGHYRRRLGSVVGVGAGLLVLGLVLITLFPSGLDLVGGPGSFMGWAVPLVSLFIIVAVTWFLIVADSHDSSVDTAQRVSCWSCAHSVDDGWRMCPYCGAELRTISPSEESLGRG